MRESSQIALTCEAVALKFLILVALLILVLAVVAPQVIVRLRQILASKSALSNPASTETDRLNRLETEVVELRQQLARIEETQTFTLQLIQNSSKGTAGAA